MQLFQQNIPSHLLIVALLEHICSLYDPKQHYSRELFKGNSQTFADIFLFGIFFTLNSISGFFIIVVCLIKIPSLCKGLFIYAYGSQQALIISCNHKKIQFSDICSCLFVYSVIFKTCSCHALSSNSFGQTKYFIFWFK